MKWEASLFWTVGLRCALAGTLLVVTAGTASCVMNSAVAAAVPDIDFLQEGIEAARQRLRAGVYRIRGTNTDSAGDRISRSDVEIYGAFDVVADRFRMDRTIDPNPLPDPKKASDLSIKIILAPDHSVYYINELRRLEIHQRNPVKPMDLTGGIIDIRALGLYQTSGSMFESLMLGDVLERLFAQEPVELVREEGNRVRIRWDHRDFYRLWWFDVENGFTPVRVEQWYTPLDIPEELRSAPYYVKETKWEQVNGVWVPVAYQTVWKRSVGVTRLPDGTRKDIPGKQEYNWQIEWESVNEAVSPALFDYRALDLPKGTYIADARSGELVVLDVAGGPDRTPVNLKGGLSWTAVIVAANLVVLVALILLLIRRRLASR